MRKTLALFAMAVLLNSCASAYVRPSGGDLKPVNRLAIVITSEPEFKVLDHRATELGVGVLFGVAGALVNSAYTNAMDSKLEGKLEPQTSRISYRNSFEKQLKERLEESKRFQKIDFYDQVSVKRQTFDAVLEISIREWGIKLIDQETGGLVPFMTVEIELTGQSGKVYWKERDVEVGRSAHSVEEYRGHENLLNDNLETVVENTAYRIASTLIYS